MSNCSSSKSSDSTEKEESTNWEKCRAVIVSGVDAKDEELRSYVEVYFQSRRKSGGGDIADVQVLDDNQLRVVFTKNAALGEVSKRVCKRKHTIMDKPVTVELDQYYPGKRRTPSSTAAETSESPDVSAADAPLAPKFKGKAISDDGGRHSSSESFGHDTSMPPSPGHPFHSRPARNSKLHSPESSQDKHTFVRDASPRHDEYSAALYPSSSDGGQSYGPAQQSPDHYVRAVGSSASSVHGYPNSSRYQPVHNTCGQQLKPGKQTGGGIKRAPNTPNGGGWHPQKRLDTCHSYDSNAQKHSSLATVGSYGYEAQQRSPPNASTSSGYGDTAFEQENRLLLDFDHDVPPGQSQQHSSLSATGNYGNQAHLRSPPNASSGYGNAAYEQRNRMLQDSHHDTPPRQSQVMPMWERMIDDDHSKGKPRDGTSESSHRTTPPRDQSSEWTGFRNEGDSGSFTTVEVTGLPADVDEDFLEMYFENTKRSSGGGVEHVSFDARRSVGLVTFTDPAVASRICNRQHEIQKTQINVRPFIPQDARPSAGTQVWVRGLPDNMDQELLEMYFDSSKKSGGEGLVKVIMGPGIGEAVITYSSVEVVHRVCSRKHVLSKHELTVSSEGPTAAAGPVHGDFSNRLLVANIPDELVDFEYLEMYFESTRRSGGGPIGNVKNYPEYGTAVITFVDKDVVTRICRRGIHEVKGVELHVTPYSPEKDPERFQQAKRRTVCVMLPPGCCDEDTVEMYFESNKRSGGGEIEKINVDVAQRCARITFSDADVAAHVASRTHKLQGKLLTVELLSESKSTESAEKSREFEAKMVLVLDIGDNINEELLCLYITSHTKVEVERAEIRRENSRALVFLRDTYDFEAAAERVKKNPLSNQRLRLRQVPVCRTVRISNATTIGLNEQFIQLYFQNLKFNVDITFHGEDADVTFSSPSDVREVLQKEHKLNKHILQLQPVVPGWDFAFADEAEPGVLADNKLGAATQSPAVEPLSIVVDPYLLQFVKDREESFRKLQQSLNAVHAAVEDFNTESLSVQPLEGVQRVINWQRRVRKIVDSFIGTLQHIEVAVSKDVLSEVIEGKEFKDRLSAFQKRGLLFVDEQRCVIRLIGLAGDVRQAKREVDNLVAEAEEALTNVIQEEVRVRPSAILLLEKLRVFQETEGKYRHVKVLRSKKKGMFIVEGPRRAVSQAAGEIRKKGQEVSEVTIDFSSQSDINLMTSAKGVEFAQALVDRAGLEAAVGTKPKEGKRPPQLRLAGWVNNEMELEEIKEKLKDLVTKRTYKLRPCETEAMQIAKWGDFVALVHDTYLVQLMENAKDHSVQLNGASEHIDHVQQLLQKFFQANAIINESLKLKPGQVRYLKSYCKDHIGGIEKKCAEFKVTVRLQKASLEIRGTEQGVRLAKDHGMTLLRNIAEDSVEVVKPGMKKYFAKEEAKKLLATIEVQNQVVIEQDAVLAEVAKSKNVLAGEPTSKPIVSVVTDEGKRISVFQGDITQHQCDVIVNAANEGLHHNGGVAKAIAEAGGPEIQEECDRYIRSKGKLLPGQVFACDPAKLPCKLLVHAVAPTWSGGKKYESKLLQRAVWESLREAGGYSSVAVPALGTGTLKFPLRQAAEIMVNTALDFSAQESMSRLHEIQFVNNDEAVVKEFTSVLEELYEDDPKKLIRPSKHEKLSRERPQAAVFEEGPSPGNAVGDRRRKQTTGKSKWPRRRASQKVVQTSLNSVQTAEGKVVVVQQGDLTKAKVDVIVNTVAQSLDLQHGMVAKVLSKAAGSGLQKECSAYVEKYGKVPAGKFAVTGGHKLHFQNIFHLVCVQYQNGDGVKTLHDGLVECFEEADRLGHSSIALPSLGTGNLGFPAVESAKTMFAAAIDFSCQKPSGSLKEIQFVVFDPKIVADFNQVAATQPTVAGSEIEEMEMGEEEEFEDTYGAAGVDVDSAVDISLQKDGDILCAAVPDSDLQVHLFKGDIVNEKSEGIVIAADEMFDLTRGKVSNIILQAAGHEFEKECAAIARLGKRKPGEVCSTKAGKLPCKRVIHACCADYMSARKSAKQDLKQLVLLALQEAETWELTSVAVPALGTGTLSYPVNECAEALLSAIICFGEQYAQSVRVVRLVLFEDKHVSAFQEEFTMHLAGVQLSHSEGPGILGRIGQYLNLTTRHNPQPSESSLSLAAKLARANVSMWLRLYGPDVRSVGRAKKEIEELMTTKHRDKVIQKEDISCLPPEDITRIQDAADEFGIDIHLERDIGRIRLRGDLIGVADASGLILEIISNAAERTRTENHADHIATLVEWVRVRGSVEEPYDKITNAKLEDGLIAKKASVEVIVKGRVCTVVFDDMEEIRRGAATIPVKRNDLVKKEELPKTWSSQQGQKVLLVQLAATDTEYQAVDQAFKRTSTRTVVKIERVQNPELYRQYTAKKESMDKGGIVKNGANEKKLYHGSDATSAQAIYTQGFNRSYAGRHATAFGRGVYFAVTAKYSEGYTQPDGNGHRCMFQSLVLAGDFCLGNSGMVAPPPRDPNISQVDLFDSTVDNVSSPGMYVTYNDAQTYPEYLITFQ